MMKRILVALAVVFTIFSFASVQADEGEVMGGSHLPPVRNYTTSDEGEVMGGSHLPPVRNYTKPKQKKQKMYYEDNMAMGNNHDPYIHSYEKQYPYSYDYKNEPVYYGYYMNGYWYNYTDTWGNPMYLYKGFYYYY